MVMMIIFNGDDDHIYDEFVVLNDRCVTITSHLVLGFPCDDNSKQVGHVLGIH